MTTGFVWAVLSVLIVVFGDGVAASPTSNPTPSPTQAPNVAPTPAPSASPTPSPTPAALQIQHTFAMNIQTTGTLWYLLHEQGSPSPTAAEIKSGGAAPVLHGSISIVTTPADPVVVLNVSPGNYRLYSYFEDGTNAPLRYAVVDLSASAV